MLKHDERKKIIGIVARLSDFSDGNPRDRRVFIEDAGLEDLLPNLNPNGKPRTVASELIKQAEKVDYLPERPNYHALGALLSHMLTIFGEITRDNAKFIIKLIIKHNLINDLNHINKLCTQYNITDIDVERPKSISSSSHLPVTPKRGVNGNGPMQKPSFKKLQNPIDNKKGQEIRNEMQNKNKKERIIKGKGTTTKPSMQLKIF
jgi:hypothetical protein